MFGNLIDVSECPIQNPVIKIDDSGFLPDRDD